MKGECDAGGATQQRTANRPGATPPPQHTLNAPHTHTRLRRRVAPRDDEVEHDVGQRGVVERRAVGAALRHEEREQVARRHVSGAVAVAIAIVIAAASAGGGGRSLAGGLRIGGGASARPRKGAAVARRRRRRGARRRRRLDGGGGGGGGGGRLLGARALALGALLLLQLRAALRDDAGGKRADGRDVAAQLAAAAVLCVVLINC